MTQSLSAQHCTFVVYKLPVILYLWQKPNSFWQGGWSAQSLLDMAWVPLELKTEFNK